MVPGKLSGTKREKRYCENSLGLTDRQPPGARAVCSFATSFCPVFGGEIDQQVAAEDHIHVRSVGRKLRRAIGREVRLHKGYATLDCVADFETPVWSGFEVARADGERQGAE